MKKNVFIILVLTAIFLQSCSGEFFMKKDKYIDKQIFAMDTIIEIKLSKPESDEYSVTVFDECIEKITEFEHKFSKTIETSDISALNSSIDVMLEMSDDTMALIEKSLKIAEDTKGFYEPTIEPLVELWNIKNASVVPTQSQIDQQLKYVGYKNIKIEDNKIYKNDTQTKIDLGSIGKGYACEKIIHHLKNTKITNGLVSFGGNIGVFGTKIDNTKWKIGVKNPKNTDDVIGYINIDSGFISVSGDYERYFEKDGVKYHHIIDPFTGYPTKSGLSSVAIWSQNGAEADALSTALFVMGADKALEFYKNSSYKFEAILVTSENEVIITDGLKDNGVWQKN